MSEAYYPKLDLGALAGFITIRQQSRQFDDYFTNPKCPYDRDTKTQLERLIAPEVVEKVVEVEKIIERKAKTAERAAEGGGTGPKKVKLKASGVDLDGVSQEIQDLRRELQQLKTDSKGLQTGDKIQIIKTRASLVEKLIAMDEKINNLKRISLFQTTIMMILEDLIPQERRLEFIRRITPFANEDTN